MPPMAPPAVPLQDGWIKPVSLYLKKQPVSFITFSMFCNRNNLCEQNACFQTTVCFLKASKTNVPNFEIPEMIISVSSRKIWFRFHRKKLLVKEAPGWFENKVTAEFRFLRRYCRVRSEKTLVFYTCLNSKVQITWNLNKNNSDFEEFVYQNLSVHWFCSTSSGLKTRGWPESKFSLGSQIIW